MNFNIFKRKTASLAPTLPAHSFCETMTATGSSPWHIRLLDAAGQKFGGGATTPALCGRKVAWDLNVDITDRNLTHCCNVCSRIYRGVK